MKQCNNCGETKEFSQFSPCKSARDGYRRKCLACTQRPVAKGFDPELAKEAKARYYERNKQKVIDRSAKWREDNREQYNELCRQNRDAVRARGYALKRKYGITLEQYAELFDKQNGCCAICGRHDNEFKTHLAVDHSHRSLRIRGLLCTGCNYRLVARHEDPALLRKIADYLEQGTEWFAPEPKKKKRKPRGKPNPA